MGSRKLRRALIVGVLCVVVAGIGSVAWAVTAAGDKIVVCATKDNGELRLVAAAKDCKKTERVVAWNASGQQGPRGLAGARGPAGPAGDDGVDGDDGRDGDDGEDGRDGDDGDDGAQGVPGPPSETKWRYVSINRPIPANESGLLVTESCTNVPGGMPQAVNGGGYLAGSAVNVPGLPDVQTGGGGTKTATQWKVDFGMAGSPRDVTLWVLCASGTGG